MGMNIKSMYLASDLSSKLHSCTFCTFYSESTDALKLRQKDKYNKTEHLCFILQVAHLLATSNLHNKQKCIV